MKEPLNSFYMVMINISLKYWIHFCMRFAKCSLAVFCVLPNKYWWGRYCSFANSLFQCRYRIRQLNVVRFTRIDCKLQWKQVPNGATYSINTAPHLQVFIFSHLHFWHNSYFEFSANIIAFSNGCVMGWNSPALPKLASDSTPLLSGPLTNEEISWVGSISFIGALLGALSFGYFTDLMGSKRVVLFLAAPTITFWSLIYFGSNYHHILIARFINGISGAGTRTAIILFVSEVANDEWVIWNTFYYILECKKYVFLAFAVDSEVLCLSFAISAHCLDTFSVQVLNTKLFRASMLLFQ